MKCDKCGFEPATVEEIEMIVKNVSKNGCTYIPDLIKALVGKVGKIE